MGTLTPGNEKKDEREPRFKHKQLWPDEWALREPYYIIWKSTRRKDEIIREEVPLKWFLSASITPHHAVVAIESPVIWWTESPRQYCPVADRNDLWNRSEVPQSRKKTLLLHDSEHHREGVINALSTYRVAKSVACKKDLATSIWDDILPTPM